MSANTTRNLRFGGTTGTRHVLALLLLVILAGLFPASGRAARNPAPKREHSPVITGSAVDGELLTASTGVWVGTPAPTYAYRWETCVKRACTIIPGAEQSTYRVVTTQIGSKLRAIVTASNPSGSKTATSKPTGRVLAGAPVDVALPAVTGSPIDGNTLAASTGTWAGTGPIAYSYVWKSCNVLEECSPIAGGTGATYRVRPLDVASEIEVEVTASNALGSVSAVSQATGAVGALLPSNTVLPSVSGLLKDGGSLLASVGEWSGTPGITYAFAWELCNAAGGACLEVPEAAASTLGLVSGMVGSTLRVVVTASNAAGSVSAVSEATSVVAALLPSNTVLPSVSGLLKDGGSLLASVGEWSGTPGITYAYEWELCNASGGACVEVPEAAASTLGLISGMVGSTLRVVVTASNAAGSVSAVSPATGVVAALLPSNTVLPSVSGLLKDGGSLSASVGEWSGTPGITYAYEWELCNASGGACVEVPEAAASTLGLVSGMVGSTLRVVVTASNAAGSVSAVSPATGVVGALLPSNKALPSISGVLTDGGLLSASAGEWSGTPGITYAYQWELCNASGGACEEISKALASTLTLSSGLVGSTLRVVVTASNAAGSVSATSAATGVVAALLPSNSVLPIISGVLKDGQLLSATTGTWSGTTPIKYSYQWELCGALVGSSCSEISGASKSTFLLGLLDVALTLRVKVTATNAAGAVSATSAATGLIAGLL